MSYTRWNIPQGAAPNPEALISAGYSPLLAAVLYMRGLHIPEEADGFLKTDASLLGDPLLLADMTNAVGRLQRAIDRQEHVAVYGDYDVDGITSACMMTDYLRGRGLKCELYIPNRLDEGYGVNTDAILALGSKGVSLIVTVDCGVTTVDEAARASAQGIDMIITDHHECRRDENGAQCLPNAFAVVDPKRRECEYLKAQRKRMQSAESDPAKAPVFDLAGVGVAFKLLCALEGNAETVLERYADLVAVGTVADVMPLTGENRYIVQRGLDKLQTDPNLGLQALISEVRLDDKKVTATNVGFTLAPRLNASGRLGQVETATELLLTRSALQASALAAELCQLNRERQECEQDIWQQARSMLGDQPMDTPIVLAGKGWHQGVIGIAASRLTEAYGVPAIMISLDGELGKGSCRSCCGFNLFDALSNCSEILEGFGGHKLAAGLTIREENIDSLRDALAVYYKKNLPTEVPMLDLDLCVDRPELLEMACVEDLDRMEPCGAGNPRPLLCLLGAQLADLTPIGGGRHLRLQLEKFGHRYEAVYFNHTAENLGLRAGDYVDAAFYAQINEFRGRRSVQLLMHALRPLTAAILTEQYQIQDVAGFLPQRPDFVTVWRALENQGGSVAAPLSRVFSSLCPTLRKETACLCLKVLEELGLLLLALTADGTLTVRCLPGRVDLESSRLLARLREAAQAAG